ncbi:MAG: hypothetical protein GQF41_2807 [Candidatus Rifleibacterium amylolyticum]|nr:MAG: hypothetical protein GQF41_2807 [Candidatus Rifleibacterium amylolyticum]NLF96704.1 hypothetical protein [Candidatus Riflebacteria bacterium]
MKLLISLLVVFLMIGFVAAPAMACGNDGCQDGGDHDDDGCGDGCGHGHEGDPDDQDGDGDGHGGCDGDSCPI